MRTCKLCGQLLSPHAQLLIAAFLSGVKDPDEHVRASSLSNLGELCEQLYWSLGDNLFEVRMEN